MSNPEPDIRKSECWQWVPIAGIIASVVAALFFAFYESASEPPVDDGARSGEVEG